MQTEQIMQWTGKALQVLFQLGIEGCLLVQQEAEVCCIEFCGSRIHGVSMAACEAIWLQKLLVSLFGQELEPTIIHCDNQSGIKLSENPVFHDRSKHIDIWYHFIRDCVQRGAIQLQYVPTNEQVADILTKALMKGKFVYFEDKMGIVENTFLVKREC
jgi:hypothetical protein